MNASDVGNVPSEGSIPFDPDGTADQEDEWIFGADVPIEGKEEEKDASHDLDVLRTSVASGTTTYSSSRHPWEGRESDPSDGLPEGWIQGVDPNSGHTYYWNANTGVSTWERPMHVPFPIHTMHEQTSLTGMGSQAKEKRSMVSNERNLPNIFVPMEERKERRVVGAREGCDVPHGSPEHTRVAFGFGGRIYIVRPGTRPVGVQVSTLGDALRKHSPEYIRRLETFPGPACWEKGEKLAKYASAQRTVHADGATGSDLQDAQDLIWGLLGILCRYKGDLKSKPGKGKSETPQTALAQLLCPLRDETSWAGGVSGYSILHSGVQEGLENDGSASSRIQDHLIQGEQDKAIKLACQCGLWSIALVLAQHMGDATFKEVASEYAKSAIRQGTPLQVLSLMLAGSVEEVRQLCASPGSSSTFQHSGISDALRPRQEGHNLSQCGSNPLVSDWRKTVAIIATNRVEKGEEALVAIGDLLWNSANDCAAAHLCYILSGIPLQQRSPESRLCLVGADHRKFPRCFATCEAIQRTELLEAAILLGCPQAFVGCFQVYKILYANRLVEAGFPEAALRYCHSMERILRKCKAPPSTIERIHGQLSGFTERLTVHLMGFNPKAVQETGPGSVLGGLGRLLDKGVNMLIGGDELDANNGSSDTHAPLVQGSGEQGRMQADPTPSGHHRRTSSVFSDVSIADSDASNDQTQRKMLDSSFMRSLSSKALGLFGSTRAKTEETIGEENKFYFDEQLGIWREEGKELPKEEEPPAPPPTFQPSSQGVQLSRGDSLPQGPPQGSGSLGGQLQRGNVRSRYVDTFAASQTAAHSQTGAFPGQGIGNAPPPGMFIPSTTVGSASSYGAGTGSPFGGSIEPRPPVHVADPGQAGLFRSASTGHSMRGPYSGAIPHAGTVPAHPNGSPLVPIPQSEQWETSNKGQNYVGHMHPTGSQPQPEHPASGMDRFSDIRL